MDGGATKSIKNVERATEKDGIGIEPDEVVVVEFRHAELEVVKLEEAGLRFDGKSVIAFTLGNRAVGENMEIGEDAAGAGGADAAFHEVGVGASGDGPVAESWRSIDS